eukprot:GHRR01015996.1.p1 GENE.GHRR01015996.1~~GHRR01015996.1.p1  ORF type:complete len:177 (+),score=57.20 GHRR01015996.1:659-1189(+)
MGNWYENTENRTKQSTGQHILGFGAPFNAQATTASAQSPKGRTGPELAASYQRTDLTRVSKCVPATLKFTHGDPHEQSMTCFATLNQLAYGEKCIGEPRVEQYLWGHKTKQNEQVPINTLQGSSGSPLGATKRAHWQQVAADEMYMTTTQAAAISTALEAAKAAHKASPGTGALAA